MSEYGWGVHWVGFLMFWPMVKKLLNIEFYFLSLKFLFKSKLKFRGEFGHTHSWYCWKALVT